MLLWCWSSSGAPQELLSSSGHSCAHTGDTCHTSVCVCVCVWPLQVLLRSSSGAPDGLLMSSSGGHACARTGGHMSHISACVSDSAGGSQQLIRSSSGAPLVLLRSSSGAQVLLSCSGFSGASQERMHAHMHTRIHSHMHACELHRFSCCCCCWCGADALCTHAHHRVLTKDAAAYSETTSIALLLKCN